MGDEGRQRSRNGGAVGEGWKPSSTPLANHGWSALGADRGSNKGETDSFTNDAFLQMPERSPCQEMRPRRRDAAFSEGRKKGTYCTDKSQADSSRAFRKRCRCSDLLPLPLLLPPFLLITFSSSSSAQQDAGWTSACYHGNGGRGRRGGTSRDRASHSPSFLIGPGEVGGRLGGGGLMTSHAHRFPTGGILWQDACKEQTQTQWTRV